jgi:hypothetical protein
VHPERQMERIGVLDVSANFAKVNHQSQSGSYGLYGHPSSEPSFKIARDLDCAGLAVVSLLKSMSYDVQTGPDQGRRWRPLIAFNPHFN